MRTGTADVAALAALCPQVAKLRDEPLTLENVEIVQVTYEIDAAGIDALYPPGLHPTIPPIITWLAWRCPAGPLGEFALAQTRLSCRSGVRPRGFLLSATIEGERARAALEAGWAYRCAPGQVRLRRGYDRIALEVKREETIVLSVSLSDPQPLAESDVQYTANMNLARLERGPRLVQVDPDYRITRAERGVPRLELFDAAAWGDARVRPAWPVSASFATGDVTLPRVRYLCRPDVTAFEGTEAL